MASMNRGWIGLLALCVVALTGCTGNSIDNGDSPNVILNILSSETPPVRGNLGTGTCQLASDPSMGSGVPCLRNEDCGVLSGEICVIPPNVGNCQIEEWTFQMENLPKTELAENRPFNDIILNQATLSYVWEPAGLNGQAGIPAEAFVPLGVTIPAAGTGNVKFDPIGQTVPDAIGIAYGALGIPSGVGASATIGILFEGVVVDSSNISKGTGGVLQVEPCFQVP